MAQSLIIFDYSGSMSGERYQTCRQACLHFREPFELWLFGDNVEKKGIVSSMPEFACNSGTSISTMLETLHTWMASNHNKYVYIFTDGADTYDEAGFTNRFNQISNRNHQVTVYDILRTNVEPLKRIFARFSIVVATSVDEITQLVSQLQQVMANDKILIQGVTSIGSSVQRILQNYTTIETASEQLKVITETLKTKNQTVTTAAEKAINDRKVDDLKRVADEVKIHITEMSDHVTNLKKNKRKAKQLKDDADDLKDEIHGLRTKIQAENASPNANRQKITQYEADIQENERKQNEIIQRIEVLKKNSAEAVEEFEKLQEKTSDTQHKVTNTLKAV